MIVEEQDENSLHHGVKVPLPKDFCTEVTAFDTNAVEHWIIHEHLFDIFKVDYAPSKHCSAREKYIV